MNESCIPENVEVDSGSPCDSLASKNKDDDDDEVDPDASMLSVNPRPVLFVVASAASIYGPTLTSLDDDSLYYLHLSLLLLNLVLLLVAIPLYSCLVPESIDSIISNGNKSFDRRPPQAQRPGHDRDNSSQEQEHEEQEEQDADTDRDHQHALQFYNESSSPQPRAMPLFCSALYRLDAFYNRFFSIRNVRYEVGGDAVNFEARLYNGIVAPMAAGFLIASNAVLLTCCLLAEHVDAAHPYLVRQTAFVVFASMALVSLSALLSMSVHWTQLKEEQRARLVKDASNYMRTTERRIQAATQTQILNATAWHKFVYATTAVAAALLWAAHYPCADANMSAWAYAVLCVAWLYSVACVALALRLALLYSYGGIVARQLGRALELKALPQLVGYWQLRRYYVDVALASYMRLFARLWRALLAGVAAVLLCMALVEVEVEASEALMPVFAVTASVLCVAMSALHCAAETHAQQVGHAKMLREAALGFRHFAMRNHFVLNGKEAQQVMAFVADLAAAVRDTQPYRICGVAVDSASEPVARCLVFGSVLLIFSRLLE